MKKVYAKFLMTLIGVSAMPMGVAMAASSAELPVEFELGPSLSISLAGEGGLRIDNLTAGSSGSSNAVTVNVTTNNIAGYELRATVGDPVTYPTTALTSTLHSDKFDMVDSCVSSLWGDSSVWGYSTSYGFNYCNLPLYTEPGVLISESDNPTTDSINFMIGAYAIDGFLAGAYNNVINFTAVTKIPPITLAQAYAAAGAEKDGDYYKMQDMSSEVCSAADVDEEGLQVVDTRDNKLYYIAKLKDGNCWMTENLDLNIDATKTYTSSDTDIPADWTPSLGTYTTGSSTWAYSYTTPESYDPGEKYWNGTVDTDWSTTIDDMPATGDSHYHIGNYYNWTAALAMNDSSSYGSTFGENATQSICPAGWTLPKGGANSDWSALAPDNQFYPLLNNYLSGATWNGTYWNNATISQIYNSPLYFVLGGYWIGSSIYVASYGYYWSSTVYDSIRAFLFYFDAGGYVGPDDYGLARSYGFSVRCVAR